MSVVAQQPIIVPGPSIKFIYSCYVFCVFNIFVTFSSIKYQHYHIYLLLYPVIKFCTLLSEHVHSQLPELQRKSPGMGFRPSAHRVESLVAG